MPFYKLQRHVIYKPGSQETQEVWGIDAEAPGLPVKGAPYATDAGDPLGRPCSLLLVLRCGEFVTWDRFFEWLSEAEEAGYELVSGYQKLTPYSSLVIRLKKETGPGGR
jgi:hypothetical protein